MDASPRRDLSRLRAALFAVLFSCAACSSDADAPTASTAPTATRYPAVTTTTAAPAATTTVTPSTIATTTTTTVPPPVVNANVAEDVFAFGADFYGSTGSLTLAGRIVDIAATPSGRGYWILGADGGVFAFGDAVFAGASSGFEAVALAPTPSGLGYWIVGARGHVQAFGDAVDHGSAVDLPSGRRVVDIAARPTGDGYWLALGDGGVLGFGAAAPGLPDPFPFRTSIVGIAATSSGQGYLLASADGGVFTFGDARFLGSAQPFGLRAPAVDIAYAPDGGYWVAAADGGVFAFGTDFLGAASDVDLGAKRVVALAAGVRGYWLARGDPPPPPTPPRPPAAPRPTGGDPAPAPGGDVPPARDVPPQPPSAPSGGVLAIGDSVMLGAKSALQRAIPGITVDAAVSRQFHHLPGVLAAYGDRGQLPGTIVIHLGTNGTVNGRDLDAAMRIAEGRRVVFVNVWVPRSWEGQSNAAIADGAARWGARIADWRAIASQPGMLAGDGYHVSGAGTNAYAAMVQAAIG